MTYIYKAPPKSEAALHSCSLPYVGTEEVGTIFQCPALTCRRYWQVKFYHVTNESAWFRVRYYNQIARHRIRKAAKNKNTHPLLVPMEVPSWPR